MRNSNYNLQILHHDEIFATRDDALEYIKDNYVYQSLEAEPLMVKYGDTRNPDIILALGTSSERSGSFYAIDITEIKEELENLSDAIQSDEEELNEISTLLNGVINATGLKKNGTDVTYDVDTRDDVIGTAVSIAEAVDLLSKYAQNNELSVEDTKSVRLIYEVNPDNGKTLKAEIIVSTNDDDDLDFNNNIVGVKTDGLYAAAHLRYDDVRHELVFTTSGYKNGRFQDDAVVQRVSLGEHTKIIADNDGHNIKLVVTENQSEYTTTLSADAQISSNEDNILETVDGKLRVLGRASKIKYNNTTVEEKLNEYQNTLQTLDTAVQNAAKTAHIEGDETDTVQTVITPLTDGGSKISGNVRLGSNNSIKVRNGGLEADVRIDVDAATNTLSLYVGNDVITKTLPGVELIDRIEYDAANKDIIIVYDETKQITIPIRDLIAEFNFQNDDEHEVEFSTVPKEDGSTDVFGKVKIKSSVNNLLTAENGELMVDSSYVDNKVLAEETRATNKESELQTALATLSNSVDTRFNAQSEEITDVRNSVTTEKERAIAKESEISEKANHADETALNASAAVEEVQSDVNALSNDVTEISTNLSNLTTTVNNNKTEANNKFAQIETTLNGHSTQISELQTNLESETTRATGAENVLDEKVNTETTRAKGAETDLSTQISVETTRAKGAETDLSTQISVETTRAQGAETDLSTQISVETTRAQGAENVLDEKVNTETTRATGKEEYLEHLIEDERERAESAENNLQEQIDGFEEGLTAEIAARKAVDGQEGDVYAPNENTVYIKNVTSLNDADIKLDEVINSIELVKQVEDNPLVYVLKVNGEDKGIINIPKDQFFKNAEYDEETHVLTLIFYVTDDEGQLIENRVDIDLTTLVDIYNAGDGLSETTESDGKVFNVKIDDTSEDYLTVSNNGVKFVGLNSEIAARKAVDGQEGDVYAPNENTTYINNAESLNDADVKLDEAIKTLSDTVIENEQITSTALNDLNTRISEMNALLQELITKVNEHQEFIDSAIEFGTYN